MTEKKSEFLPLAYVRKCFCKRHFHVSDLSEFFYRFAGLACCL